MLKKTKGKMKRRNTESSMQLALQAAPSNEPEPEVFWVTESCSPCKRNEDVTPRVSRICTRERHGSSTTRNKRNRPRNSSVWATVTRCMNLYASTKEKPGKRNTQHTHARIHARTHVHTYTRNTGNREYDCPFLITLKRKGAPPGTELRKKKRKNKIKG